MKNSNRYKNIVFRLKSMMLLRLFFSIVFLISAVFLFKEISGLLSIFIGIYFAVTVIYGLMLRRGFDPKLFSYVQIFFDVIIISFLILATSRHEKGPVDNTFVFLYILPILAAGLFFKLKETVIVALFSSSLYILIVLGHYLSIPEQIRVYSPMSLFTTLYMRTFTFCLVGFFCGYLSSLLHKSGEEFSELKNIHDQILFNMNSGVITTDIDNNIIYLNHASEKILGYDRDKMIGQSLSTYFCYSNGEAFLPSETDAQDPNRENSEILGKTAGRTMISIGYNLSFIRDSAHKIVGKVMVFTDLTEVKELEHRARRSDQLKTISEMAAGMAHEIRNPLASIRGSIEMLAENMECTGQQERLLKVLLKESDRLNNIVENFLNDTRESKPTLKKHDISRIISEVVTLCSNDRSRQANVELEFNDSQQHECVLGDEAQLKQVFFNLIKNAFDSIEREGKVSISIDHHPAGEDNLRISISDTGEGIEEAEFRRIFEPFYTTKSKGFGIGLSLTERIIRNHNGTISVESRPGTGSTFSVNLPTA